MKPVYKDSYDATMAFRRGEEGGFNYFFEKLFPTLLYYAFRISGDKVASEDIVVHAFVKIWERHNSFDHPQVIKAYLYTSVRNACINEFQQKKRVDARKEKFAYDHIDKHQESILHDIIVSEVISEIHATMKSLPSECRKIFDGLYVQGKTVRELAEELHLSISTIKNQKARGLSILRKNFPDLPFSIEV